jgi:hypothetical protein
MKLPRLTRTRRDTDAAQQHAFFAPRLPWQRSQPTGRGRSRSKYGSEGKPARTRAQLADRAERRPTRAYGARETPRSEDLDRYGTRNYPPRRGGRPVRDVGARARSELTARARLREAQGHPASRPHPRSGEGARSTVRARGVAPRPSAALPNMPRKLPAAPQRSTGRAFSGGAYIGRPPRGTAR